MFYDTHAHLFETYKIFKESGMENDIKYLFQDNGIKEFPFILDIGLKGGDLQERKKIYGEKVPENIFFSVGIWPSKEAIENQEKEIVNLINDIETDNVYCVGEAGFDRRENPEAKGDLQGEKKLFLRQAEIAKTYNLPLIIHSRDAYNDTYQSLKESGCTKGIIHCFSYGLKEAMSFIERGFYISFSGIITYKKNESLLEALKKIPGDRILLETDSPYLTPKTVRGRPNCPAYIKETYKKAAEIREITEEEMCRIVSDNTRRLLNLN